MKIKIHIICDYGLSWQAVSYKLWIPDDEIISEVIDDFLT